MITDVTIGKYKEKLSFWIKISPGKIGKCSFVPKLIRMPIATSTNPNMIIVLPIAVGTGRLELPTSRSQSVRSNQLNYVPNLQFSKPSELNPDMSIV